MTMCLFLFIKISLVSFRKPIDITHVSRVPFVKEGIVSSRTPKHYSSILMKYGATDWRINFDFAKNNTIPSETLVDTLQRPDIVIYSISKKVILWFEETIPLERNIVDAALRKEARYASLKTDLKLKDWIVHDFTFEIGALGFVAKSFNRMLSLLGFPSSQRKHIRNRASKLALRSSFYIWSNRFSHSFSPPKLTTTPHHSSFPITSSLNSSTFSSSIPHLSNTSFSNFSTPLATSSTHSSTQTTLLSTLSKFKDELNAMTPIDLAKWSSFASWSTTDQNWFKKHIPNYELDCLLGLNPFKNSLRNWFSDSLGGCLHRNETSISTTSTTSTTTTTTSSSIRSLADSFQEISLAISSSKSSSHTSSSCSTFSTTTTITTTLSTTSMSPAIKHSYEARDFGTPPEMYFECDFLNGPTSPP